MSAPAGVALVTGAGRRIGRAIAWALADAGWDVAVHYGTSAQDAAETVRGVEARGRRAMAFDAELAESGAAAGLIARAAAALGPVTLGVNNASVFEDDALQTLDEAVWDRAMAVNLRAPVRLTRALAAALPPGAEGCVVNVLDQRVLNLNPRFFSYTLSKAALWAATRTMAQALAPRVRVNGVGPGPTLASIHQDDGAFGAEAAAVPLGRAVDPAEIASAVVWLAGAKAVTGQMIAVDSGQHLAWRTPDVEAS